ncbi:hypothetical protein ACFE04_017961 [Oxalis oulophora]
MFTLSISSTYNTPPTLTLTKSSQPPHQSFAPFSTVKLPSQKAFPLLITKAKKSVENESESENENEKEEDEFWNGFRGKQVEEEKNYDKDPEFADILGTLLDDPQKAQSKMEDRLRKKRDKILQSKTGSATLMKFVSDVARFDFTNSYIWFEFYNTLLPKDVTLITNAIRSWHIIGRLGGCNSLNMQLSQSPFEKRPTYDATQGANVEPGTFYNIGDLEIQDKLARVWVDIGTTEPLLLDVLINALTQISSDYVGIKQVVFGGDEFEDWKENLTSEDVGSAVHKI